MRHFLAAFFILVLIAISQPSLLNSPKSGVSIQGHFIYEDGTLCQLAQNGALHAIKYFKLNGLPSNLLNDSVAGVSVSGKKVAVTVIGKGIWIGTLDSSGSTSQIAMHQEISAKQSPGKSIALVNNGQSLVYFKTKHTLSLGFFTIGVGDVIIRNLVTLKEVVIAKHVYDNGILSLADSKRILVQSKYSMSESPDPAFTLYSSAGKQLSAGIEGGLPRSSIDGKSFIAISYGISGKLEDDRFLIYDAKLKARNSSRVPTNIFYDLTGWYGIGINSQSLIYLESDTDSTSYSNAMLSVRYLDVKDPTKSRVVAQIKEEGLIGGVFSRR
jgi:hypothetical protein